MRFTVTTTENSHVADAATFINEDKGWDLTVETTYAVGEYVIDPGDDEVEEDDDFYVSAFVGFELLSASGMVRRDFLFGSLEPSEDEKQKIQAGYEAEGNSYLEENGWTLEDHVVLISGGVEIEEYLLDDD
jgi:hypothetical protein